METSNLIMQSYDENFALYTYEGEGVNNTPYTALECRSYGLACTHVVEIRLNSVFQNYEGKPIHHRYRDCYVSHGMRSRIDSLEDTEDYIGILEEALEFAREINHYIRTHKEWRAKTREE